MKTWKRATRAIPCGAQPDCAIAAAEPYLELQGPGRAWTKIRCQAHAGEPVPDTIEEPPSPMPAKRPVSDFASMRELAARPRTGPKLVTFDYKAAQAGERDDDGAA